MELNGFRLLKLDEVGSTNTYIKQNIESLNNGNWVVTADYQTKGKGQNTHIWQGEKNKNLYCSLLLRNDFLATKNPFIINKAIALATRNCIAHFCQLPTYIKWPNDLFVNDKKISGILIENTFAGANIKYSICGIGININQINFDGLIATSLNLLRNKAFNIDDILTKLTENINYYLRLLQNQQDEIISQEFDKNLYQLHETSTFKIGNKSTEGIIKGCDKNGKLLVKIDGKIEHFGHGDITLIK